MPRIRRILAIPFNLFFVLAFVAQSQEMRTSFVGAETPLTAPSSRAASDIARDYLVSAANQLNLSTQDLDGLFLAKEYKTAHNGVTHLVYRQQFQGIEVFNAEWVTNIDRDGSIVSAGGTLYGAPPMITFPDATSSLRAVRAAVKDVNPGSVRPMRRLSAIDQRGVPTPWHTRAAISEQTLKAGWCGTECGADSSLPG